MTTFKSTLLATALLVIAPIASAATDTTSFNVKINITSVCDIHTVAATDVDFGTVASTATNVDQQGQLTIACTPGTSYTIALNNGQNGADVNSRAMKLGTNLVPYQLYRASARGAADVWGSTTGGGGNVLSGTGTGLPQNQPVYGRTPSTNFPAGAYNDVVTATVTY